jgi:hypothetical protein
LDSTWMRVVVKMLRVSWIRRCYVAPRALSR